MSKMTMQDYIEEAVSQANQNIEHIQELTGPLLSYIMKRPMKKLWLIASGSSYNACHCARNFMLKHFPHEVVMLTPFTFTYYEHDIDEHDVVLVITQSGLSTNAIEALKKIKELHHTAICLTGNINSDVSEVADLVIDYGVGEELVGYVTKGVTTLCLFLELITVAYTQKYELLEGLKQAIQVNSEMIISADAFIKTHYKNFSSMDQMYICGAGGSIGVAMEGALKVGETIHIPSNYYEIEEYIHGPNLQLTPSYNVLIIDDNEQASDRIVQVYQATKKITDRTYIISNHPALVDDDHAVHLSKAVYGEFCSLAYLPFVQLLSHKISQDLNSSKQHPLLKAFKKIASAKTGSFVNYDGDD